MKCSGSLCASVSLWFNLFVFQSLCVAISLRLTVIDEKGVNLKDTQAQYTRCGGYAIAACVFMS